MPGLAEAIDLANATPYGLTASVFTTDERTARRCLAELDAGLVKVNAPPTGSELHAPFGGLKDSSFPAPREEQSRDRGCGSPAAHPPAPMVMGELRGRAVAVTHVRPHVACSRRTRRPPAGNRRP